MGRHQLAPAEKKNINPAATSTIGHLQLIKLA